MTREEQIQNYAYNNCITEDFDDNSYSLIVDAIKWADETIIERACEWLEENIDAYSKVIIAENSIPTIVLTEDFEFRFKKAMEE